MLRTRTILVLALALMACARARAHPAASVPLLRPPNSAVVDKVVAVVLNRPITLSECEMEARISFAQSGDLRRAMGPISPTDEAEILPELVDRSAVLRGLRNHYQGTLDPALPDRELDRLRKQFPDEATWHAFLDKVELSDEEVEERLRRGLEARSIIVAKLKDLVAAGRKEVDEYMAAHPGAAREKAEAQVAFQSQSLQTPGILADARRSTGARIIDPIVMPPEGAGTALGTTRDPPPGEKH